MIVPVTPILMNSAHLETVKTHLNDRRRREAHKAAREVLDEYANGSEQVAVDMSGMSWWEDYVASQAVATEMTAVGITCFSIQSILGIKDPNRGGRDRVDFIVFLADGTHWRFHPGSKQKSDAQPVHIQTLTQTSAMLQSLHDPLPLAPSHQCLTPGANNVLTVERANEMKQIDRMGKKKVWERIQ